MDSSVFPAVAFILYSLAGLSLLFPAVKFFMIGVTISRLIRL